MPLGVLRLPASRVRGAGLRLRQALRSRRPRSMRVRGLRLPARSVRATRLRLRPEGRLTRGGPGTHGADDRGRQHENE